MKKIFMWTFGLLLSFSFASCGGDDLIADLPDNLGTESPGNPNDDSDDPNIQAEKILIVYFSRTGYNYPNQWLDVGHTARVAGYIADLTGGDRFEILPVVPYPDNYQETVAIAREEYDNDTRPAIQNKIENLDDYDTVFIGNPIWHGAAPMIIRTFYESYDLTGKVLIPFSTHAGSGLGDSERLARNYYPDNTVLSGLAVQGTNSPNARDDVEAWLKRIGIIE
ncbi:flavodoxin [Parabacteroides distasonis]|uniref:flavodoxin n=1 Tax=Parabacteroides distasonis TaxID=823 RepID=UPI00325C229C